MSGEEVVGGVIGRLTPAQRSALRFVRTEAGRATASAMDRMRVRLGADPAVAALVEGVARRGRVALHFHPDRLVADGSTVAEGLLRDGVYRSQFETGISNGGLTAVPGGERDLWEQRLFSGAYQRPGVTARERPKYGALDLFAHPDGPAPRFGSAYLLLCSTVLGRCTFSCGDSVLEPTDTGTLDAFEPVLAGLIDAVSTRGWLLGRPSLDVAALVTTLTSPEAVTESAPALLAGTAGTAVAAAAGAAAQRIEGRPGRSLDEYVEVQVHGDVRLDVDVAAVVADPSFRNTPTGGGLAELADRVALPLLWHPGFGVDVEQIPADFRGPLMPDLGRRVQREFARSQTRLDVELIGRAAASVNREPDRWADLGEPAQVLQCLKQLWHVLVRFG